MISNLNISYQTDLIEVGCDEVGRGCLAGPVVAAAVILPLDFHHDLLNDSKLVSEKNRKLLDSYIKEKSIAWSIGVVNEREIDEINILNASFLAMHRAIDQLKIIPEYILVDGNRFNQYKNIPHRCIVKGDSKFLNIAAASIIAKNYRDEYMTNLHFEFPYYDWIKNKGYPTKKHRLGIINYGVVNHHRLSFKLLDESDQLKLNF